LRRSQLIPGPPGAIPQNFAVATGPTSKVSFFSTNANTGTNSSGSAIGLYGANITAPFKATTAASVALGLTLIRCGNNKKDPEILLPSIQQFTEVESAEEFSRLIGSKEANGAEALPNLPNVHFLHPQIFVDIKGKREWDLPAALTSNG
jgi:hypothetical protein